MNAGFLVAIAVMAIIAMAIVVLPLVRKSQSARKSEVVLVLLIPAVAIALYVTLGSPGTPSAHANGKEAVTGNRGLNGRPAAPVSTLVEGLRARLEDNPRDAGGWLLLARSYRHLGRHEEAATAYRHAKLLGESDPQFEAGATPLNTPLAEKQAFALRGRVTLAPELTAEVSPGDTVFIFAKESREQRMPLVAIRRPASELPIEFALSNADAMLKGTDISAYDQLVVTARVSKSGRTDDAGLEAWSAPVSPTNDQYIELTLARLADQ